MNITCTAFINLTVVHKNLLIKHKRNFLTFANAFTTVNIAPYHKVFPTK